MPPHISAAASEAHKCNSIGSRRAATLMARSVVEATAKDKGFETGSLFAKIDAMEEAGILRRVVGHAAHSIRLFGNDMAHGDFIEPVGADEANMVMSLMNLILDETYRIPAEVSAIEAVAAGRRARRQVRRRPEALILRERARALSYECSNGRAWVRCRW